MASLDRQRHGPSGPARICSSYARGLAGAELWVARHEAWLRADVGEITRRRETVRGSRLNKGNPDAPFDWFV
jgi:hypothetical protein